MSITSLMLGAAIAVTATPGATPSPGSSLAGAASLSLAYAPTDSAPAAPLPWQDDAAEPAAGDRLPSPASFGAAGTTRWYLQFGGATDFASNDANFGLAGVGLSKFIADGLSLNFEFNAMLFDQPGDEAGGLSLGMLIQWHFSEKRTSSWFLEAGIGILGTNDDVPANGSSFNFTPQAGIGYSFDVSADTRMLLGVRWFHISNARLYEENPGRDSLMFYLGFTFAY